MVMIMRLFQKIVILFSALERVDDKNGYTLHIRQKTNVFFGEGNAIQMIRIKEKHHE